MISNYDKEQFDKAVKMMLDNPQALQEDIDKSIRNEMGEAWFNANKQYLDAEWEFIKHQFGF